MTGFPSPSSPASAPVVPCTSTAASLDARIVLNKRRSSSHVTFPSAFRFIWCNSAIGSEPCFVITLRRMLVDASAPAWRSACAFDAAEIWNAFSSSCRSMPLSSGSRAFITCTMSSSEMLVDTLSRWVLSNVCLCASITAWPVATWMSATHFLACATVMSPSCATTSLAARLSATVVETTLRCLLSASAEACTASSCSFDSPFTVADSSFSTSASPLRRLRPSTSRRSSCPPTPSTVG
mmetsp:Transcript_66245/g.182877  ORF Transcript_66245/g.182877 Transcript_66245/m.182877 type:complete len:238 (-) Transcript_66245:17-730(-)